MRDQYTNLNAPVTGPATKAGHITPSDATPLTIIPKAVYVGTGGTVVCRAVDSDEDVVFKNLPSPSVLPVRVAYIRSTGTTAQDFVGLY